MTLAATLSITACALELVVGFLCLGFSQAPGWRSLRVFAFIAFSAACYSAANVPQTLACSASLVVWSSQASLVSMALHVAGWVVYSGMERERCVLRRSDLLLLAFLGSAAVAGLVPGLLARDTLYTHEVPALGLRYRTADPTPLTVLYFVGTLAATFVPLRRYWLKLRAGVPGALTHALAFCVFLATALNEILVAGQVVAAPYLMDLGLLTCVLAVSAEMTRRVVEEARALLAGSDRLERMVEQRNQELTEAQQALARAERMAALGQLAAGVAHEINNPLSVVLANANSARQVLAGGGPVVPGLSVPDLLADIGDAADRIRRIVTDLKVFSHPAPSASGGTADLCEVIGSTMRLLRHELRPRARVHRDDEPVPPVTMDPSRLAQVLVSLLHSAAQSIPEGRAAAHTIFVRTRYRAPAVLLEVEDSGAGLAPEELKRVFEPFFTTKEPTGGMGLGLALGNGLVRSAGGRFEVESAVGRGTRIRVYLPAASAPAAVLPEARRAEAGQGEAQPTAMGMGAPMAAIGALPTAPSGLPAAGEVGRPRVLCVDDEPLLLKAMALCLHEYDVTVASSGTEALRLAALGAFEAVVCDLTMPDLSGVDVYEKLRADGPGLAERFAVVTGGPMTERSRAFLQQATVPVITKPFEPDALRQAVAQLVANPP